MKIYISGKITGTTDYMERFSKMEKKLTARGYEVINPAKIDDKGKPREWSWYMRRCIKLLVGCDAIYMLEGWETSDGAALEHMIAQELGIKVFYQRMRKDGIKNET